MLNSGDDPDYHTLDTLIEILFKLAEQRPSLFSNCLPAAVILEEWRIANFQIDPDKPQVFDTIALAHHHLEIWRRQGIAAEPYHFKRAKEIFTAHFDNIIHQQTQHLQHFLHQQNSPTRGRQHYLELESNPKWEIAKDWAEYARLLMNEGEMQMALDILTKHVVLPRNENDEHYADYLFYTGVACKALKQHERANYYFFEATQFGPPKCFTKIDMMTIISRTLEEMKDDVDFDEDDGAYQIVSWAFAFDSLLI